MNEHKKVLNVPEVPAKGSGEGETPPPVVPPAESQEGENVPQEETPAPGEETPQEGETMPVTPPAGPQEGENVPQEGVPAPGEEIPLEGEPPPGEVLETVGVPEEPRLFLETPFSDYTVTEGFLFLIMVFLAVILVFKRR